MWPFRQKAATGQPQGYGGPWRTIFESAPGNWQRNVEVKQHDLISASPILFACLDRISSDLSRMPWRVKQNDSNGIPKTLKNPAVAPTLRRPNDFQNWGQFVRSWSLSKLQHGNALILKNAGQLYVLNWEKVEPLVSSSGSVFYRIHMESENNLLPEAYGSEPVTVPASATIHDRGPCLYHELIGISPVAAAYWATAKSFYINKAATEAFSNGNELSGILTIPAGVSSEDAQKIRDDWNKMDYNSIRVLGADASFHPLSTRATDSQVAEQLELSAKQICSAFSIPPFVVGATELPSGQKPAEYMLSYYKLGLAQHVHAIENLLTDGLDLPQGQFIELGTDVLLRMDEGRRAEVYGGMVKNGIMTRNEARREFGLVPVPGGGQLMVQQQDIPIDDAGGPQE